MFSSNFNTGVVVRALLISVIFVNSLASSTASVQAKQELTSKASANAPSTQQENNPGCNAEPCSITPSSSTSAYSLQSFAATGSVTGITDPTLIPNPNVYDFSADEPDSAKD